jgi:hypothetical protein
MSYIGSTPTTQSFIAGTDSFNGTGSQTNFTLSRIVNSVNDIQVVVNNVVQYPPNYSVSGTTLTISPAPSSGTNNVYVRYLSTTLQSITVPAGSTVNGGFGVSGDFTVGGSSSINSTVTTGYRLVIDNAAAATGDYSPLLLKGGSVSENGGQLALHNTYAGVPTPKKWLRIDNSGRFQVINNAYTSAVFTLTDGGDLSVAGTMSNSSGQVIKNVVNSIRSTAPTLVTFGTSFANINTTYYKWDLPSSGDYIVWCTVRSYLWSTNAFGKVRLYNNTAGAVVTNSDTMLIESQTGNLLLNLGTTLQWKFTASGATTLYLQGGATVAGTVGIQSDSNGYDEFGYIKVSV